MVDFTCKKLLRALNESKDKYEWGTILEKLTAEEYDNSSRSFNSDLVLEQSLEPFKREPRADKNAEELRKIYEDRYALPLSGIRPEAAAKEVVHE